MVFSLQHHPPFLHSFTLLRLPPGSCPRSQKGAHLIASRFRHTRWVSERIRRNGVHARTKREIEERQKEERDEGSTDTPTSLPLRDIRYIRRELPTKKKNGFNVLYSLPFSSWKSVGALEPWEGTRTPQLSPTWRLPTQKNTTLSMLASVLPMQACESYGWWMKPHLFVKGKAITLKSTVSLSNTQSTSRTIATQSKRWEAPHAPVCPTDTQTLWLEETMKHFNRQEKK